MKLFKIIYNVFVGLIVVVALLLVVSVLPITGNFKVLTVISGSMEPAIKTGSVVVVKPATDYKIGEIITFGKISKTQVPITHRIQDMKVESNQAVYITKGDANNAPDTKEVKKSEVIGKVIFSLPYIGYAVDVAKKPYGFILIIIIPALLVIYDEAVKIYQEFKKIKKKEEGNNK